VLQLGFLKTLDLEKPAECALLFAHTLFSSLLADFDEELVAHLFTTLASKGENAQIADNVVFFFLRYLGPAAQAKLRSITEALQSDPPAAMLGKLERDRERFLRVRARIKTAQKALATSRAS
jgi:hypothetical protein